MLQHAMKSGLIVAVLGLAVQDAQAFGRCGGWGCGGCGYGGYGYAGYGYGGWGYGGGYGYGGGGYGGYAGYSAPAYGGYAATTTGGKPAQVASIAATGIVSASQPAPDAVVFTVNVPSDAKVFVNDQLTTSTGELRKYTSLGVQPNALYSYRVRAEFTLDGKPVSEEKTVSLTAGQSSALAFNGSTGSGDTGANMAGVAPSPAL